MLVLLMAFALSLAGINFLISYANRDFMTAFSLKEEDEFFKKLLVYLIALCGVMPVTVFYRYTEERLALLWRLWLSRDILRKYFSSLSYYKVQWHEGIDNPDQRIEEDIRSFTTTSLSLFLIVCNSLLTLVLFVGILWTISIKLIFAVLLYTGLGSLVAFFIGRKLISLNFAQLKKEGNYRYKLVNVRDHAESIAFYRGHFKELTRVRQRLKIALSNSLRIINLNRNLNFFITLYNSMKPIVPLIIVAPLYLHGSIEFGVVTQAADAFVRVAESLSILIQNFGTISAVVAVVTRLGSFAEALEEGTPDIEAGLPQITVTESENIACKDLTIVTPKRGQTLIRNLTFEHSEGGLLIVGPSGQGKTSFFRVLAGLWTSGHGTLVRPPLSQTMFIPQKPYLIIGSLRNQLLYALPKMGLTEEELEAVIKQVRLTDTLKRVRGLDAYEDWNTLLSTGEQQQLAFARLLLACPHFAFLDEATTAVDLATEEHLYGLLKTASVGYISIGNRNSLAKFHQRILQVRDDGSWKIESC